MSTTRLSRTTSSPEHRSNRKDIVGCLVSICQYSLHRNESLGIETTFFWYHGPQTYTPWSASHHRDNDSCPVPRVSVFVRGVALTEDPQFIRLTDPLCSPDMFDFCLELLPISLKKKKLVIPNQHRVILHCQPVSRRNGPMAWGSNQTTSRCLPDAWISASSYPTFDEYVNEKEERESALSILASDHLSRKHGRVLSVDLEWKWLRSYSIWKSNGTTATTNLKYPDILLEFVS